MATNSSATLVKAVGSVYVERNGTRYSLAEGDELFSTDTIITDSSATAELAFADGTQASLSPGTTLEIQEFVFEAGKEPSFILGLTEGAMRSVSGEIVRQNPEAFSIRTPQSTIGIRGTELFNSVVDGKETHIVLHIGKGHIVLVTTQDGREVAMDGPLHGIELTSGNNAPIVVQKYSFDQMEDLIHDIAPSLSHDLATPQTPENMESANEQQTAQQVQEHAVTLSSSATTVTIIVEENAQADPAVTEALATIQTALLDMGVTLNVLETTADNVLTESSVQASLAELAPSFVAESGLSAGDTSGTSLAPKPGTPGGDASVPAPPNVTPTPPTPTPPIPDPYVLRSYDTISGSDGITHLPGLDANTMQKFVVTNSVNASLVGNALLVGNAGASSANNTAGDIFDLNDVNITASSAGVFGDAQTLAAADGSNLTFGADAITVNTLQNGIIAGDVNEASEQASASAHNAAVNFGNDSITIKTSMQNGTLVGDAYTVSNVAGAAFTFGNDTVTINSAQNGFIGGDAYTVQTISDGNFAFGKDTINVTTLAGAILAGDAHTLNTVSGGDFTFGNDKLDITTMQSGTASGDLHTLSNMANGDVEFGNDSIHVTNMQNGIVTGDAHSVSGGKEGELEFGSDTIKIVTMGNGIVVGDVHTFSTDNKGFNLDVSFGNDTLQLGQVTSGIISGDAHTVQGNFTPLNFGNDTIGANAMAGGILVGDVHTLTNLSVINGSTIMGDDAITVDTASHAEISGDAYSVNASNGEVTFGNDSITVDTMNDGTIWGDFKSLTGSLGRIIFGNDTINVKNFNGGNIYGDSETPPPSASTTTGGNDTIHIENFNGTTGTIDAGAGDDTVIINNINALSTALITGGAGHNTFQYASDTGHTMTLNDNGSISIDGHSLNIASFQGLAGGAGNDTLTAKIAASGAPTAFIPELAGGAGADTFKLDYSANANGTAIIKDFNVADMNEKIMVKGASGSFVFSFNAGASDGDSIVINYSDSTSTSSIRLEGLDGSSSAVYDQIIANGQLNTFA